jgi:outer membrane murein-binding lipoprotein Lpp
MTIVIVAVVAVILIIGGVVTAIVLLSGSSGPSATLDKFFTAAQTKDVNAAMKLVDMSYFAGDQSLEKIFRENIFADIPKGVTFSGLEYETTIKGDKAGVQVVKGTATYNDGGTKKTVKLSKSSSDTKFDFVKKNGEWLMSPSTFGTMFAAQYKQAAEDIFNKDIDPKVNELGDAFKEVNTFITSQPIPSGAAIQAKVDAIQPKLDAYKTEAGKAKEQYQKIVDLNGSGLDVYQEYAKAGIGFIDTSTALFDEAMDLEKYVAQTKVNADAGQQVDKAAYEQHVNDVSQKISDLQTKMEDYQSKMSAAEAKIQ